MVRVLRSMNSIRVPLVYNSLLGRPPEATPTYHAPKPLEGCSVLDVGCGAGFLTEVSLEKGMRERGDRKFIFSLATGAAGCQGHWCGAL